MSGPRASKATPSTVGMMDGAFFVGRIELLRWVNDLLAINCQKVEQCANGAVYCQVLDACHPRELNMKKVNWMARVDHEFIPNYKLLQAAFDRLGIQRNIDVDKLIRGKYQDNLEFLQWMKCYFDHSFPGHDYDPYEPRSHGKQLPEWAYAGAPGSEPVSVVRKERARGAGVVAKSASKPRTPAASNSAAGGGRAGTPGVVASGVGATPPVRLGGRGGGILGAKPSYLQSHAVAIDELEELKRVVDG